MKKLLIVATTFLLFACNNASDTSKESQDTATTAETEESIEPSEVEQAKISFPQLFSFYESEDSSFTEGKFDVGIMDSMNITAPQPLNEEELKPYYPYLVYTKDSSKAIDLYSYNVMLSNRNGKTVGQAAGPDTEIAVIDFRNKTRQRIFYAGPSFVIHDGQWIDNKTLSLVGGEVIDDNRISPFVWMIDIDAKRMKVLDYNDTLNVRPTSYKAGRIPMR
jgi:hypothetical protein